MSDRPPTPAGLPVSDREEWLQADAASDEVVLEVDGDSAGGSAGLVLLLSLVVTPARRTVHLDLRLAGARALHDAEAAGPPPTNWDRMTLGGVEWRMVEPLQRWDLSVDDPEAGLRAYLTFSGTAPPVRTLNGYEQLGTVTGEVRLAETRTAVTVAPARRTHLWREAPPN